MLQMFERGDIDRNEKTRRLTAIDAEMPAAESSRRAIISLREGTLRFGVRDWDNPAAVNAELRNLWDHVELDPATMLPIRAVWTIGQEPNGVG